MSRYYFHLLDGDDQLADHEGVDLADLQAVTLATLVQARDILAGDVRRGRLGLNLALRVVDEAGSVVHALPFVDAVAIDWPSPPRNGTTPGITGTPDSSTR